MKVDGRWQRVRIGDVSLRTGQRNPGVSAGEIFSYVDISSVSNKSFSIETPQRLTGAEAPSRARKEIRFGDTLFATVRPLLRRVALVPSNLDGEICSTGFCILRPNRELVDPGFLYLACLTDEFVEGVGRLQRGSGYPAVSNADVLNQEIALPPLEEQKAIAQALGVIRREWEQTEQVVAASDQLRLSYLEGAWDRKGDWEHLTLGEILERGNGSLQTGPFGSLLHAESYVDDGAMFVMPKDMSSGGRIDSSSAARVGHADYERLERYQLASGDLVVGRRGEIGRHALVMPADCPALCGSGSLRVRSGSRLDPEFLAAVLSRHETREWLKGHAVGSTMLNLNTQVLREMPLGVPPLEEQRRIAGFLRAIRNKSEAEELQGEALAQLFKTLLHEFMAEIRRIRDVQEAA